MTANPAPHIDHTILKAEATRPDVMKVVSEALEHSFASVCINGVFVPAVAEKLKGTGVKTCAVVGFPLGAMSPTVKAIEATSIVKAGAHEVDVVAHLPHLLNRDVDATREELLELTKAVRGVLKEVIVKVIIESAALLKDASDDEAEARIAAAATAAREAGCDFIKTSTGFHPAGGASLQAVQLMVKHAGPLQVKASGGIRTPDDAKLYLDAGATRLGCSASVAIATGASDSSSGY
ncbi:MAG: deoxyribose-phosphate aldolase [Planctomycetota bacterium]